ncbi:cysteine synthase [Candidatus Dojkabacteria bacterium]|nr:cysteine synthase [Candidatus Dojkabacteria bacterium]
MKIPSLIESIGNTPLINIQNLKLDNKVNIYGKFEGANPGGSIKDRPSLYMIEKAEQSGELTKDKIILEATSGNTGIGLAMIAAYKGYRSTFVLSENASKERIQIMKAFGSKLILTPSSAGTNGPTYKVREMLADNPEKYFFPNQYDNENNSLAHYETTGPEIWEQTEGKIDIFIAGIGTSGTLMGIGRYLKEKNNKIKIVGIEPPKGHKIQGLKNMIEAITPKIFYPEDFVDDFVEINDDEAFQMTKKIAKREGLFVGMSSGAAVAGALKIAKQMDSGNIVTILPDRGDRYLSTNLFD